MKNTLLEILFFQFKLLFIFFFFFPNKSFQQCSIQKPILKNNTCVSVYCTKEQFNSKECQIENETIKTQWLNNIIDLEITSLKYVSLASYSDGDLILQVGTFPANNTRRFLGFKKNGRPFFENKTTNEFNYFYSMEVNQSVNRKFESSNVVIKLNGSDTKEYLLSVSKEDSFVEIYDFENYIIYQKHLYNFSKLSYINSFKNVAIPLFSSNNNEYYYLFGFIGENDKTEFILEKHIFKSLETFEKTNTSEKNLKIENYNSIFYKDTGFSCFQTEQFIIICFLLTSSKEYVIIAYNSNLEKQAFITIKETDLFFTETFINVFI